jgi:hypothetical protein
VTRSSERLKRPLPPAARMPVKGQRPTLLGMAPRPRKRTSPLPESRMTATPPPPPRAPMRSGLRERADGGDAAEQLIVESELPPPPHTATLVPPPPPSVEPPKSMRSLAPSRPPRKPPAPPSILELDSAELDSDPGLPAPPMRKMAPSIDIDVDFDPDMTAGRAVLLPRPSDPYACVDQDFAEYPVPAPPASQPAVAVLPPPSAPPATAARSVRTEYPAHPYPAPTILPAATELPAAVVAVPRAASSSAPMVRDIAPEAPPAHQPLLSSIPPAVAHTVRPAAPATDARRRWPAIALAAAAVLVIGFALGDSDGEATGSVSAARADESALRAEAGIPLPTITVPEAAPTTAKAPPTSDSDAAEQDSAEDDSAEDDKAEADASAKTASSPARGAVVAPRAKPKRGTIVARALGSKCRLAINGVPMSGPVARMKVAPGRYRVSCYGGGKNRNQTVRVQADQIAVASF